MCDVDWVLPQYSRRCVTVIIHSSQAGHHQLHHKKVLIEPLTKAPTYTHIKEPLLRVVNPIVFSRAATNRNHGGESIPSSIL